MLLLLLLFDNKDSLLCCEVKEAAVSKSEFVVLGLPIILGFVPFWFGENLLNKFWVSIKCGEFMPLTDKFFPFWKGLKQEEYKFNGLNLGIFAFRFGFMYGLDFNLGLYGGDNKL